MLVNDKYNLGREYEFYATILQRSKGGAAIAIKKINSTQKTKHKNNLPGSSSGGLHGRKNKKDNISSLNKLSNRGRYERSPKTEPSTIIIIIS